MTQLIVIGCYLALLLGLGLFSSRLFRGTSKDYMLASHSIGPFMLLMSIFGTTMTAFALVGSSGEAFKEGIGVYGMLASSSGIIHSLCFFVLGVKLWSFGRKYGYTTQAQFFRDRLENDGIGLLLFPILVGLVIPYLLIGVMASGTVINSVTAGTFTDTFAAYDYGVPAWFGSLVICGVVLIYVFFGGMRGTAWANTFQTIVFLILGVVTFFLISSKLGGLQAAGEAVAKKHPGKLMRTVTEQETQQYKTSLKKWQLLAYYNWNVAEEKFELNSEDKAIAHETVPGLAAKKIPAWKEGFVQRQAEAMRAESYHGLSGTMSDEDKLRAMARQDNRILSSPLPKDWQKMKLAQFPRSSAWNGAAMKYFGDNVGHPSDKAKMTIRQAKGRYRAMRWAPQEPHSMSKLKFFTYLLVPLSVGMFPHLFQHWLTARSASSFKLAIVAHPIFIMIVWVPCVLVGVWATSANMPGKPIPIVPAHFPPNAVLVFLVKQLTSPLLGGLLTAGILAAIMSSLDSQFLCIGTMFTNDIVVHYGGENRFTDRQKIAMARLFIVAIVAVTYGFSLFEPRRVFTLGVWCFSGFSSLFPLILAALYWRRLTAAGAYAAVLASATSWGVLFSMSGFGMNSDFTVAGMMPVATMVACSTAAMVVVSLISKPPSEKTLKKFFT